MLLVRERAAAFGFRSKQGPATGDAANGVCSLRPAAFWLALRRAAVRRLNQLLESKWFLVAWYCCLGALVMGMILLF